MASEGAQRPSYDELLDLVRQLQRRIAALEAEIARLREENGLLRDQLDEARRAGKRQAGPFSKGAPKASPKKPGRKKGKEHGPPSFRKPPDRVDEVHDAPLPKGCPDCGTPLREERVAHQFQTEIPKVDPFVRRFDIHVGSCPCCGKRVQGRHPLQTSDALGAAACQLGPNVLALAAHLNKVVEATYGKVAGFFREAFGIEVSRGGLARAMRRVARTLSPTYSELCATVRRSNVVYPDETSMRVAGRRGWLWAFTTPETTVYVQRFSRGTCVIEEMLGLDFQGALGHDGWAPYDQLVLADHQQCYAHLLRRCHEMLEVAVGGAAHFPRAVKRLLQDALALQDQRHAGTIGAHGFASVLGRLQHRFDDLMDRKLTCGPNRKLQGHLRRHADQVFTFLHRDDVEPTAHRAEQAIRPAVIFRKISGGHRSETGAHTHDVLVSVFRTCWQRGADAFALVRRALCAATPRPFEIALGLPAP